MYILNHNFFNLYNVIPMYNFRANHLVLNNQLIGVLFLGEYYIIHSLNSLVVCSYLCSIKV